MNAETTHSRGYPNAALAITLLTTSLVTMNTATAAAPRAGYDAPRRPLVEVVDARLDRCLKIDKQTGQVVPCQSAGGRPGSSSGTRNDSRPGNPSPSPAFNEFEYDYTQADFDADPESVVVNAYLLSQLAGLAYRPPGYDDGEANGIASDMGLDTPMLLDGEAISRDTSAWHEFGTPHADSKAFVFFNQHAVFVTFEGSVGGPTGADWLENNIDIGPHDMPAWGHDRQTFCTFWSCYEYSVNRVTLHQGFFDAMDVIYDDVLDVVRPLVAQGRSLWITGHSLGGAVAVLTAFRLSFEDDVPVHGVHVFGAPAVGDYNWLRAFEAELDNVHRWHAQLDPIPVLLQAPAYYHVGQTHNLYDDGSFDLDVNGWQMFGYPLACSPLYRYNIAHMSYWDTMHLVLDDVRPDLVSVFPTALEVPQGNCLTW